MLQHDCFIYLLYGLNYKNERMSTEHSPTIQDESSNIGALWKHKYINWYNLHNQ